MLRATFSRLRKKAGGEGVRHTLTTNLSLADAKARKYVAQHFFDVNPADDALQGARRQAQVLGDQFQRLFARVERALKSVQRIGEGDPMPLQRDQRRRRSGHSRFRDIGDGVEQAIESRTGRFTDVRIASAGQNSPLAAIIDARDGKVFVKGLPSAHRRVITQVREAAVGSTASAPASLTSPG